MSRLKSLRFLSVQPTTIVDGGGAEREVQDSGRHRRRSMTRGELAAAWLTDRMPVGMRGRLAIGGRELGLVALVGALGLCAAAALALRSSAAAATPALHRSAVVSAPTSVTKSHPAAPLVAAAGSAGRKEVVVDVAGAVLHPGV